jgi:hypothetical protein
VLISAPSNLELHVAPLDCAGPTLPHRDGTAVFAGITQGVHSPKPSRLNDMHLFDLEKQEWAVTRAHARKPRGACRCR